MVSSQVSSGLVSKRNGAKIELYTEILKSAPMIRERGFKGTICSGYDAVTQLIVANSP